MDKGTVMLNSNDMEYLLFNVLLLFNQLDTIIWVASLNSQKDAGA